MAECAICGREEVGSMGSLSAICVARIENIGYLEKVGKRKTQARANGSETLAYLSSEF